MCHNMGREGQKERDEMGYRRGQKDLSGMNILITEDNRLCAEMLAELLKLRHATVTCADSGEEAVRIVDEMPGCFDAVLMDVQMPGMDGYDAARAIRATGNGACLPVFAMTAENSESERRHALDAGMNAFLPKPLQMNMLAQALTVAYA